MNPSDSLRTHADLIRASAIMGRSGPMPRLFDFLVECSLSDRAPKEIEIALDVFQKDARFDVSQDALVRVYIHKLRRKLDEFYDGPGRGQAERLAIPRGEYRLVIEPHAAAAEPPAIPVPAPTRQRRKWLWAGLAASLLINGGLLTFSLLRPTETASELEVDQLRRNPIWSSVLDDNNAIVIALGDYYIFGQINDYMNVERLVRDFSINSPGQLRVRQENDPDWADHYMDLGLTYLPTSSAFAISKIMPILASARKPVRISMVSELTPATLKRAHVIYIGYLSGLGMLNDLVFAGSQFTTGDTYDELIDRRTRHKYVSEAGVLVKDYKYVDYGYFSTFPGPADTKIIVIAGTRDEAVLHTAEQVTSTSGLQTVTAKAAPAKDFEALYEVYGLDRTNLQGKLLQADALDTSVIWSNSKSSNGLVGALAAGASGDKSP